MSFEFQIARRYLTQKKETGFITLITYISIVGLTIGVAALIITMGVLDGFERSITEKIIDFQAHIRLETYSNQGFVGYEDIVKRVQSNSEVAAVSPFIEGECMLRKGRQADGLIVRGVVPDMVGDVINVEPLLKQGTFDLTEDDEGDYGIVVGIDLFERFNLNLGDRIVLAAPPVKGKSILGSPVIRQYRVTGAFETGMSEFDDLFGFIILDEAQSYFDLEGKLSGIDIKLHDINRAREVANGFSEELGYPFFLRTWHDLNVSLFDWMAVQRLPILIAFGMIILIGSMNLINTLVLVILEKKRDIGILKSMGATSRSIMIVFILIGIIVGFVSTAAGSALAWGLAWLQNSYQIVSLSKDVYYIGELPIDLDGGVFLQISVIAILLCLTATLYPAWTASRQVPAETVRES